MRIMLTGLLLLIAVKSMQAQTDSLEIFDMAVVSQQAEYPGGQEQLYKYISQNIVYPRYEGILNVQGRVFVEFVVERNGQVSSIKIKRGVSPGLDAEAINVVRKMGRWKPAMMDKRTVRMRYVLPVNYTIPGATGPEQNYPVFADSRYNGFYDYIAKNLVYPLTAQEAGIQGVVRVKCYFSEKGELTQYDISEKLDPACDNEALRLVKEMPKWSKGEKQTGPEIIELTIPFILPKS